MPLDMTIPYLPVDRERAVHGAVQRLVAGGSVLIFGSSGIGKTHVGNMIADRVAQTGAPTARIRSTADGETLYFGRVDPASGTGYADQPLAPMSTTAIEHELAGSDRRMVVHVDDAHNLDDIRSAWLASLVDRTAAALVIALGSEDGPRPGSASSLYRLWAEERASRIDLAVLDRHQTDHMVGSLTGGMPVDTATRLGIYRGSGGLPLLIRELAREVTESGLVTGATGTFIYPLPPMPSKRIIDIVWHRMGTLSDDERNALVILARLEGIPAERAKRYLGAEVLRRLLITGFAFRDEATSSIRQTHRIEAETVQAVSGGAQLQRLGVDVARMTRRDLRAGVGLTPLEYVLLAETMLGDGDGFDTTGVGDDAAEIAAIFLAAAGKCLSIGTIYSGLSFARASSAAVPSIAAIVEESRCLCAMGNRPAAVAVLETADRMPSTAAERALLARWRVRLSIWSSAVRMPDAGDDDPDDEAGLGRLWQAKDAAMAAEWDRAAALCWSVVESDRADTLTRVQALGVLVVCVARAGDGAALNRAIELGDVLTRELRWTDAWEQSLIEFERDSYAAHRILAQILAGIRVDELGREIDERIDSALAHHDFTRVAILGSLVGFLDLVRGDTDAAETELRLATDRLTVVPDARWTVWIPALRAETLVSAGRTDEARELLARLSSEHPHETSLRRYTAEWIDSELSVQARSEVPVDDSGAAAASRSPSGELLTMVHSIDLAADADAARFLRRATELRSRTDLPLLHGMADYVVGMAQKDAALLETSARELASVSYYAIASTAAAASARVHSAAGHRVAAAASDSLARDYRARRGLRRGVSALPPIDLTGLTTREREIVTLVADGRTNREVADALFLSVRTVESHFYQARVKLGAMSRQELTRLVRLAQDRPT